MKIIGRYVQRKGKSFVIFTYKGNEQRIGISPKIHNAFANNEIRSKGFFLKFENFEVYTPIQDNLKLQSYKNFIKGTGNNKFAIEIRQFSTVSFVSDNGILQDNISEFSSNLLLENNNKITAEKSSKVVSTNTLTTNSGISPILTNDSNSVNSWDTNIPSWNDRNLGISQGNEKSNKKLKIVSIAVLTCFIVSSLFYYNSSNDRSNKNNYPKSSNSEKSEVVTFDNKLNESSNIALEEIAIFANGINFKQNKIDNYIEKVEQQDLNMEVLQLEGNYNGIPTVKELLERLRVMKEISVALKKEPLPQAKTLYSVYKSSRLSSSQNHFLYQNKFLRSYKNIDRK